MNRTGPFIVDNSEEFKITDLVDENEAYSSGVETEEALKIANAAGLDLVCFSMGRDCNPLCKLVDYGRLKYQLEKKKKKNKTSSRNHELKEIRFSPTIGDHDVDHKIKHAKEFIEAGNSVNFTMRVRRRQNRAVAISRMNEIVNRCEEFASIVARKEEQSFIQVKIAKKKENTGELK